MCTDTWSPINSVLQHPDTGATGFTAALVYDVDSDAMVAYTSEGVFVYDAELDQWHHHPAQRDDSGGLEHFVLSAAYHPASGMIITASFDELVAHDIDTDEWTPIASPVGRRRDFLGVNTDMDRFVFGVAGSRGEGRMTWLVDPLGREDGRPDTGTPVGRHRLGEPGLRAGRRHCLRHRPQVRRDLRLRRRTLTWNRCFASSTRAPPGGIGRSSATLSTAV